MNKTKGILLIILALLGRFAAAQTPNTIYFMHGLPQSHWINPSIQPACNFYLGLPGLAPLRLNINSSSLAVSDIIYRDQENDTLITAFHPLGDKQRFLDALRDKNFINLNSGFTIASFGFRAGDNYFSFDITNRVDGGITYPKGIFEFLVNGAPDGSNIVLDGLGPNVNLYNEFSMGWSRRDFILENLDIGFRGKILFGLGYISTSKSNLNIETGLDQWRFNSDMQFNIAAPSFVTINEDLLDADEPVQFSEPKPSDIIPNLFNFGNTGLALDIGASYRPIDQLKVSLSILDLGGIRWKNSFEGTMDFTYDFKGIEFIPPFEFDSDTTFGEELINEIQDSILGAISFVDGTPHFDRLNPKIYAGVAYYPIEKIGFGLLSRTEIISQSIVQQFTGSVNMTTGKFINLSLSYSYMNRSFNNAGAGLSLNVGPFNLYIVSDNVITAALRPLDTRSVNLWFGMNITAGWDKMRNKKIKEYPLIL